MKSAPFKYVPAESVDEVLAALGEYGDEAKILAGGQSLVPLMNMRLATPGVLVDVNRIRGLDGIKANGGLEIGAVTRQLAVQRSPDVESAAPMVTEALRHVGHTGIRSRATFGGTIAHADPAAEIPAVLLALEGEVVARGPGGERTIAADDLFVTYFTTTLAEYEMLTHARIPKASDRLRFGFLEVARRHGDFALVGVAAAVEVDGGDVCQSARIVIFGVGERPIRALAGEQAVVGERLSDAAAQEAAARATSAELEPKSDVHASSQYRKEVAGVLVRRALVQAATRGEGR